MSLGTSNRDGGKTSESGHLRALGKAVRGDIVEGLIASQRAAGNNMSVDISIGDAFLRRSDGSYAHPVFNDAVYNQAISTADGSNPRRDIVVIYVDYAETPSTAVSNNTNGVVKIKVVNGTPAGSPVDPDSTAIQSSVGSGNPWAYIARVRVPAGQSSISNSLIDDLRVMASAKEAAGTVKDFAGATAPSGWLFCYGQAVSRTTYIELFRAIGTTFGAGDGSTTFTLPDARGRVIAGKDDMGGSSANRLTDQGASGVNGDVLGDTGGAETHTLVTAEMPAHSHNHEPTTGVYAGGASNNASQRLSGSGTTASGVTTGAGPTHSSTGGGDAHNNLQPTMVLNKIIAY